MVVGVSGPPTLLNPATTDGLEGYLWTPAIYATGGSQNNTLLWHAAASGPTFIEATLGNSHNNLYPSQNFVSTAGAYNLAGLHAGAKTLSRATGFIFEVAASFDLSPVGSCGFIGMGTANIYGDISASDVMTGVGWKTSDSATMLRTITATGTTLTAPTFARTGQGGLAVGKRYFRAVMSCPPDGTVMTIDLFDETCQFQALSSGVSTNTWSTLLPTTARAGGSAAGSTADWVDNTANWYNEVAVPHYTTVLNKQNGRYLYCFRGGASSTLDVYDIAANTWINAVIYGNQGETFSTGSNSIDLSGSLFIIKEATG